MNPQEYIYKAGLKRSEIIDKTLWAILKARRPKTFAVLNLLRWRWLWKLLGIRVEIVHQGDLYEKYRVFQFDELLATFDMKPTFTTS